MKKITIIINYKIIISENAIKNYQNVKFKSLANSMGILLGKLFHYDLTRAGIAHYMGDILILN